MRWMILLVLLLGQDQAANFREIFEEYSASVVYLEVRDDKNQLINRGTGFIVSPDGHIITVAHLRVMPSHNLVAVVGQRDGTALTLQRREADEHHDVALWQLPQSRTCQVPVTINSSPILRLEQMVVAGFPGTQGLTASRIGISNTTSPQGFYKADGYLEPGNSGGPVLNERGEVIAIVQGGTRPGTESNDLIPISHAIALIQKNGVQASINQPPSVPDRCYASCRDISHGIEGWAHEEPWGPVDSGWLPGGHGRPGECAKLIAAALVNRPGAKIELFPGEQGMWEEKDRDVFGHTEYKYFCRGILRAGPIYVQKRSRACGLVR